MARIIQGVKTPKNPFPAKRKIRKDYPSELADLYAEEGNSYQETQQRHRALGMSEIQSQLKEIGEYVAVRHSWVPQNMIAYDRNENPHLWIGSKEYDSYDTDGWKIDVRADWGDYIESTNEWTTKFVIMSVSPNDVAYGNRVVMESIRDVEEYIDSKIKEFEGSEYMASAKKSRKENSFPAKRKVKKESDWDSDYRIQEEIENDIGLLCEWTNSYFVQEPILNPDSNGGIRVKGVITSEEGGSAKISVWVHPKDMEYQLRVGYWYEEEGYDLQDMLLEAWGPYYETFGKSKNSVRKPRTSTSKRKVKKYLESDLDTLDDIFNELQRTLLRFSVTDSERKFTNECADITGALNNLGSSLYHERSMLDEGYADWYNGTSKSKKSKVRKNTLDFEDPEVEFLLNGERIESDEDLKTKIRAGLDADIESGANGIKAYLEAEGELGDWEDSNNRDYILDSISRQIHSAVSYYLYEGEEDEYPEFGMTFTPTIKSAKRKVKKVNVVDVDRNYMADAKEIQSMLVSRGFDNPTIDTSDWILNMDDEFADGYNVEGYYNGCHYLICAVYDTSNQDVYYDSALFREEYGLIENHSKICDTIDEAIDHIQSVVESEPEFHYEASMEGDETDVQAPQDDLTDIEKTIASKRMKDGSMGDLEKFANGGPLVGQFQPFANNYRTITMGRNTMSPLPPKIKRI